MSFAIVNRAIGFGRKVGTFVKPYLPTIMVIGGSAAVCGGAFFACKATLHVDDVLEEHRAMLEHINNAVNELPDGSLTDKEITHDKLQTYAATAGKMVRLYAPAIGLGLAGFASIFAGFGMIKNWHALAVSSVAALDEKFGAYRAGVIEKYGEDVDKELAGEVLKVEKATIETVNKETGETKTEEKDVVMFENVVEDDFTRIFDCNNSRWENDFLMNDNFIRTHIDWYTHHLQAHRMNHVFLNTILKEFGFEETGVGHFYGWTDKPGCAVNVEVTPCLKIFDHDEDNQFPMLIPMDMNDEMDETDFRQAYIEDDRQVCYIMKFKVDTDANGVPREIYHDVYDKKVG